jgi:deoxyribodipyrimidine photo-lyase
MNKENLDVIWFKRDLRAHDHAALEYCDALSIKDNNYKCLGIYIVESDYWKSEKASLAQKVFALESAICLATKLEKIGGRLLILEQKDAVEAIEAINKYYTINRILTHRETGNKWTFDRDLQVQKLCRILNIHYKEFPQDCLIRGSKSKINDFSHLYYSFASRTQHRIPTKLNSPSYLPIELANLENKCLSDFKDQNHSARTYQTGGEDKAIELLISFLDSRCLDGEGYRKSMSKPESGAKVCSRISPHLTWGSISARACVQTAQKVLNEIDQRDPRRNHIKSFLGRMGWRSHFMQKFETLHWMEFQCINPASENLHAWDDDAFECWANGQTGYPFVDACMRSLNATKWLNFRARALVVSFASYALNLDWRGFGPHLARNFLDYEPGIHYSQLQMQGGTTIGSPPRIYSPLKQSIEKDPDGSFIRTWIPELRDEPTSLLHLPCDYPRKGYPPAVVDPSRLWAIMRSNAPKSNKAPKFNTRGKTLSSNKTKGENAGKILSKAHTNNNQLELALEPALSPTLETTNP